MESAKSKFEQEWRDAFQEASVPVSDSVWNSLEGKLAVQEAGKLKRWILFYRIAAASLICALVLGYSMTRFSKSEEMAVNLTSKNENAEVNNPSMTDKSGLSKYNESSSESQRKELNQGRSHQPVIPQQHPSFLSEVSDAGNAMKSNYHPTQQEQGTRSTEVAQVGLRWFAEPDASVKEGPRVVTLYRKLPALPSSFMTETKKKSGSSEKLWASVGASAGSFNPNASNSSVYTSGTSVLSASGLSDPRRSTQGGSASVGYSYSFGVGMGYKIATRWVVQSGLSYMLQNFSQNSNLVSVSSSNSSERAFSADYISKSNVDIRTTSSSYKLNNVNEVISFPVQAGYLAVNKRFALQVNAGLAADIFMRSTLSAENNQFAKYSTAAGGESPYRTVTWAGLTSSELSYKISNHYRISLIPGLRYSFNSVLKSQSGSISNPVILDVGFKFRYIFK